MKSVIYYSRLFIILAAGLAGCLPATAQEGSPASLSGTIKNTTLTALLKTAPEIIRLKPADKSKVMHNMDVQQKSILKAKAIQSLKGNEARLYGFVQPATPFHKLTTTQIKAMFYQFINDHKSGKIIPEDEAPAMLTISTNDLDNLLFNVDDFYFACDKAGFPQFFQKFPMMDSTKDYMEIKVRDQIVRVIQLNNKPVFIPLSRNEFFQFLIKQSTVQLAGYQTILKDNQQNLAETKVKLKEPQSPQLKEIFENSIHILEENIARWKNNVQNKENEVKQYEEQLAHLSPEDVASDVYLNINNPGNYFNQLLPAGRKDGVALYKVNPAYFNKNASPSEPQLITVSYWYHPQFCPVFLKNQTEDLFFQINYHELKNDSPL